METKKVFRSKCKTSGKLQYKRWDAGATLQKLMITGMILGDYERTEKNMYVCKDCNAWHLTSQRGVYTELYENMIKTIQANNDSRQGKSLG